MNYSLHYVGLLLWDLLSRVSASSPLIFSNSGGYRRVRLGGGRMARRWGMADGPFRGAGGGSGGRARSGRGSFGHGGVGGGMQEGKKGAPQARL